MVSGSAERGGGRRRVPDQLGLDHDALARAVLRVAGHQRQPVVALVLRISVALGPTMRWPDGLRRPRPVGADLIGELALQCLDEDLITRVELVDAIERCLVGRAVTGKRRVARLAGHRCLGEVARALLQPPQLDAFDHVEVGADGGNRDETDRSTTLGRRGVRGRDLGRRGGRRSSVVSDSASPGSWPSCSWFERNSRSRSFWA